MCVCGTNCAPLVADLFLFCYGGDFGGSLAGDSRGDVVWALGFVSRCLGGPLCIVSPCFEGVVGRICPPGLQLGGSDTLDAGPPFWVCVCLFLTALFIQGLWWA